ncbi:MAG: hypothetical protein RID81_06850 [Sandaracinaceae bacterium]
MIAERVRSAQRIADQFFESTRSHLDCARRYREMSMPEDAAREELRAAQSYGQALRWHDDVEIIIEAEIRARVNLALFKSRIENLGKVA